MINRRTLTQDQYESILSDTSITPSARVVLTQAITWDSRVTLGIAVLSRVMGVDRKTVYARFDELRKAGYLTDDRQTSGRRTYAFTHPCLTD